VPLARALAAGSEALSRVIGRPPLVSRGQVYFFNWNAHPLSAKAQTGWAGPTARGRRATHAGRAQTARHSSAWRSNRTKRQPSESCIAAATRSIQSESS
jgi:hypothetical protein